MRSVAPSTTADLVGGADRKDAFGDGVHQCGVLHPMCQRCQHSLSPGELGLGLLTLQSARDAAKVGCVEAERIRQVVPHAGHLEEHGHQVLRLGTGRRCVGKFDVLPGGQMVDLSELNVLSHRALLVVELARCVAVHRSDASRRAGAVGEDRECRCELRFALGELDHLVEIAQVGNGGVQLADASIGVQLHGVHVVDELRRWHIDRIGILTSRHATFENSVGDRLTVIADQHATDIVLADDVLINAAEAVWLNGLQTKRQLNQLVRRHRRITAGSHKCPAVVSTTIHSQHAKLEQSEKVGSICVIAFRKPLVVQPLLHRRVQHGVAGLRVVALGRNVHRVFAVERFRWRKVVLQIGSFAKQLEPVALDLKRVGRDLCRCVLATVGVAGSVILELVEQTLGGHATHACHRRNRVDRSVEEVGSEWVGW